MTHSIALLAQARWSPSPGLLVAAGLLLCATFGVWLAWRALFGDRARGRPRCPKCGYSMHLAPSRRCPECGTIARDDAALLRTRRHWRPALVGLLVIVAPVVAVAFTRSRLEVLNLILPRWWPVSTQTVAGYTVRLYADRSTGWGRPMQARISRSGVTYATIEDHVVELGASDYSTSRGVGVGEDINADGVPDLIITQYSGGANCCFSYTVLALTASSARFAAHIPAELGATFEDIDGDGVLEVCTADPVFMYWNASRPESARPAVILRWDGAAYVLAADLMAAPPIAEEELAVRARQLRETDALADDPQSVVLSKLPLLCRTMLELIYTGHPVRAAAFLDQAWPADRPGKEGFRRDFETQLRTSRFWRALRAVEAAAHPTQHVPSENP